MGYEEDLPAPLERWRHQVAQPDAFLLLNFLGELSRRVTAAYGAWLRALSERLCDRAVD